MKRILLLILLCVSCSAQRAQYPQGFDFWKHLAPDSKFTYVSGYLSGAMTVQSETMGTCMALWMFSKPIKAAYTQEQWQRSCFPSSNFNGSITQFRDGMETFYSDFRNQQIGFDSAMKYVRDQIAGKPQAELDADLQHLRKCAADYTTCLENNGAKQ
jgi:hypothetical protein